MRRPYLCLVCLVGLLLCGTAPAAAKKPSLGLQCVAYGKGPMLECTARLRAASGRPLEGAKVSLNARMPSMPMAHTIRPVVAGPTGQGGEYRGVLQLEMPGVWAIEVDIAGPPRDRLVRRLRVEPCESDRRCVAVEIPPSRQP